MAEVASAYVTLLPSFKGGAKAIAGELNGPAAKAGRTSGAEAGGKFKGAFVGGLKGIGGAMAGVFAAEKIGSFFIGAVQEASDAQQSIGATETVFAKAAASIIKNSQKAATKYGLSANTYRENANLIGSLFRNQGVAADQLAAKTDKMISIGADLAATFGGSTTDAVNALGSAFKGEFDSLERYGISIKQSNINALLAARGQDKLTGAALKAATQQATTDLIMKQSSASTGAFAKESDTLAHKQQVLGAKWDNLKTKLGNQLLPVITTVTGFFSDKLLPALGNVGDAFAPIVDAVKGFAASFGSGGGLGGISSTVAKIGAAFATLGPPLQEFGEQLLPVLLTIGSQIKSTVGPAIQSIGSIIATQVVPAFKDFLPAVTPIAKFLLRIFGGAVIGVIHGLVNVIKGALGIITGVVKVFTGLLTGDWGKAWDGIKQIAKGALKLLIGAFQIWWNGGVLSIFKKGILFLTKGLWKGLWDGLKGLASRGMGAIERGISGGLRSVLGFFRSIFGSVKSAVSSALGSVVSLVKGLPRRILNALGNLGKTLYGAGKDLIQGLINGASSLLRSIGSFFVDKLPGWIKGPFKAALGIASPSKVFAGYGENLVEGVIVGVGNRRSALDKVMASMVSVPPAPRLPGGSQPVRAEAPGGRDVSITLNGSRLTSQEQAQMLGRELAFALR